MPQLFKKLNLAQIRSIHVLNAPASFEAELRLLDEVTVKRAVKGKVSFALAFVVATSEVAQATELLVRHADGDAVLWMAYPKASSKKYQCEFNRDTGWKALGDAGYEPVRQVAIDAMTSQKTPQPDSTFEREFVHSRLIDAPRERVFHAFGRTAQTIRTRWFSGNWWHLSGCLCPQ